MVLQRQKSMNQEMTTETKELTWAEEHPWLAQMTAAEDDDSVDDVITASLSMNNRHFNKNYETR